MDKVEDANYFLESNLTKILDQVCPFKTLQYWKNYKPWISKDTIDLMEERDKIREDARITDDPDKWTVYRSKRNIVNARIEKERKEHFANIYRKHSDNNDAKATFRTAKDQAGWNKTETPVTFHLDGKIISAPQKLAETQMNTFHKKTTDLINNLPPPTTDPLDVLRKSLENWGQKKQDRETFEFSPISEMETLNLIKHLGNNTSTAHDNLDAMMIKLGVKFLHRPIRQIINLSIANSSFAARWKIGQILPLYKGKGLDKFCPTSYRPISLLPDD